LHTYLVGYGTLLHRGSLGHSIGRGAAHEKNLMAVVVRDYRRLFNLRPDHYESSSKLGGALIENGALNLEEAAGESFNGLAFPVEPQELENLDERERYYERIKVPMYSFETGDPVAEGYVYAAAPDAPWVEHDNAKIMPLWRDIVWSREGAYQISDDFGRKFDDTTYLADGTTLVVDHYGEMLEDTSDVDPPE